MMPIETTGGPIQRAIPTTGQSVLAVTGLCWLLLLSGAGMGMGISDMSVFGVPGFGSGMDAPLAGMKMPTALVEPSLLSTIMMWWVMMMAMMLPGTLFHVPVFDGGRTRAGLSVVLFLAGYALVWLGYSLLATALQYILVKASILHPMTMWSTNAYFSVVFLVFAGIFQFTKAKARNLSACQKHPTQHRPLRAGLQYGAHCVFASFALMGLLFVGGVMNIYWIVGLTLIVAIEKLLPAPRLFSAVIGFGCLLLATANSPVWQEGL
jgi:predicted metal-binding membrane protein